MSDNQFDEFFKNKLDQYSSQVPEDMWQRIHEKKRRRFLFIPWNFFTVTAILVVGGVSSYYFFFNKTETSKNRIAETLVKDSNEVTNDNEENKNYNILKHDSSATLQANNTSEKNYEENFKNKKAVATPKYFYNPKSLKPFADNIAATNDKKTQSIDSDHGNVDNAATPKIETDKKQDSSPGNNILKNDLAQNNNSGDSVKKIETDEIKNRFALELYASPVLPFGNFKGSNSSYTQLLNDNTNYSLSYAFGFRMKIYITDNIFAKIGAQYTIVNQKYPPPFFDDYATSFNKYKSLDIPLIFGYQFNKLNYKLAVNAGVLINIHSAYKGILPNIDSSGLAISSAFRKTTGASFYVSADLAKQYNDRIDFFAEPYLTYRLSNMALKNQLFTQKINTAGISFGMRYKLFKQK